MFPVVVGLTLRGYKLERVKQIMYCLCHTKLTSCYYRYNKNSVLPLPETNIRSQYVESTNDRPGNNQIYCSKLCSVML